MQMGRGMDDGSHSANEVCNVQDKCHIYNVIAIFHGNVFLGCLALFLESDYLIWGTMYFYYYYYQIVDQAPYVCSENGWKDHGVALVF